MTRECFYLLCKSIQDAVGIDKFRSETYLSNQCPETISRLQHANIKRCGGYISGEIKLAITLRLLAGASYLDLELVYKLKHQVIYNIFHQVLRDWICNDKVIQINFYNNCTNLEAMKETSWHFANGTSSGKISGCIGAIDGLLIKMVAPSIAKDNISNVANFFSRKGFFAINTQVIVDKQKRILWHSIKCKGAEHDSSAFKATNLYKHITKKYQWFIDHGLYLVGDTAYSQRPFLITPYDNAKSNSKEDTFNYHLSACRIYVECAFGEIYKRWGILWRPLSFRLNNSIRIIESIFRLHNIIIQYELDHNIRTFNKKEQITLSKEMHDQMAVNISNFIGYFGDDNTIGNLDDRDLQQDKYEKILFQLGKELREKICEAMQNDGLRRPLTNIIRDEYNIVHIDD